MKPDRWDCQFEEFIPQLQGSAMIGPSPKLRREFCKRFARELAFVSLYPDDLDVTGGAATHHIDTPMRCDLCQTEIANHGFFADGETKDSTWANMCPNCYAENGVGIGWAIGQLYRQGISGGWRCILGGDQPAGNPARIQSSYVNAGTLRSEVTTEKTCSRRATRKCPLSIAEVIRPPGLDGPVQFPSSRLLASPLRGCRSIATGIGRIGGRITSRRSTLRRRFSRGRRLALLRRFCLGFGRCLRLLLFSAGRQRQNGTQRYPFHPDHWFDSSKLQIA